MINIKDLLKNRFLATALAVSLLVLILVIALTPKKSTTPLTIPTPTPQADRPELVDLNKAKRDSAATYISSIESKLPIYLYSFPTSVGITTSINIYRLPDDPKEVVRLEIYGLSYLNAETNEKKNPNVTTYKESYAKAMDLIEGQNIDPRKLIFIYGDKEYVRKTTQIWIDALKLHP